MEFQEWLEEQDESDDNLVEKAFNYAKSQGQVKIDVPKTKQITLYRNIIQNTEDMSEGPPVITYYTSSWMSFPSYVCKRCDKIVKREQRVVDIGEIND